LIIAVWSYSSRLAAAVLLVVISSSVLLFVRLEALIP
jgi:hypothetical protein